MVSEHGSANKHDMETLLAKGITVKGTWIGRRISWLVNTWIIAKIHYKPVERGVNPIMNQSIDRDIHRVHPKEMTDQWFIMIYHYLSWILHVYLLEVTITPMAHPENHPVLYLTPLLGFTKEHIQYKRRPSKGVLRIRGKGISTPLEL